MQNLLDDILKGHGGGERWATVTTIAARGCLGGLLPKRFAGTKLANFRVEVEAAEQRTILHDFPQVGKRGVFDRGNVRIEDENGARLGSRVDARRNFFGPAGMRRNVHWDPLDVTYFAGYAMWNYLTSPLLFTRDDVVVTEGESHREAGQRLRRLEVTFPTWMTTHCRKQTFFVDASGLIRRHDFVAEPVSMWAQASLVCDRHRQIDGLVFPMRRRVFPRGPGGRIVSWPTLLKLEFDEITIQRSASTANPNS